MRLAAFILAMTFGVVAAMPSARAQAVVGLNPFPVTYDLPRIEVPIIKRGKSRGVIKLTLVMEVPTPEQVVVVQANESRFSNAIVRIVADHFDKLTTGQKEIDLDRFKVRFRNRAFQMFGEENIRDVLIVNAQIQAR